MGWKSIKDHYKIGHFVAIHEGKGICIGSPYVHDLIRIDLDARTIKWGNLGPSKNDDLARYWDDFYKDLDTFWALVDAEDQFDQSLPVYTYEGGEVVQCLCEEYGWPNVTHDGQMMYENMFFECERDAREAGIQNARAGIENLEYSVAEACRNLKEKQERLAQFRSNLAKLLAAA